MHSVVYEHRFFNDQFAEIRVVNDKYQCYITPLYGGEFDTVGKPFSSLKEAKNYLLYELT